MTREPEALTEQALQEDDYWFQQRYQDTFYASHGHQTWETCPADCKGRSHTVTADGHLRNLHRISVSYARYPEYQHPDETDDGSLMDLFTRYDEMEIPE